eukprot:429120-Prymnesium_polylepis.1
MSPSTLLSPHQVNNDTILATDRPDFVACRGAPERRRNGGAEVAHQLKVRLLEGDVFDAAVGTELVDELDAAVAHLRRVERLDGAAKDAVRAKPVDSVPIGVEARVFVRVGHVLDLAAHDGRAGNGAEVDGHGDLNGAEGHA